MSGNWIPGGRLARSAAVQLSLWALLGALASSQQNPGTVEESGPSKSPSEAPASATGAGVDETGVDETTGPFRDYRSLADRDALLSSWLESGFVERLELGRSVNGRELFAIQLGGKGTLPLQERTTVFLLGGLDGVSLAGSEAVISVIDGLLGTPEELPGGVTFIAVPWASPDGLARWKDVGTGDGRNDRSSDDDDDGRVDEDGPDDLDGDGCLLQMLIEDPAGPWARASDPRFLRPAASGEAPRFCLAPEGRDDDGDGTFNEDPPGGVNIDLNFPVGWRGPWCGLPSGIWPLSEPEARAIVELALTRRTAIVLLFQGNHGLLAGPGGLPAGGGSMDLPISGDESTFRGVAELFGQATGRNQKTSLSVFEARGEPRPGAAVDWFYAALGALAAEVAVWGPGVAEGSREPAVDAQFFRRDAPDASSGISAHDHAWARWLDDTRGGIGFVEWQPVELGSARKAWVGGWQPFTCLNPPPELLPRITRGLDAFVRELARRLPALEIEVEEASRDGRVCLIRARVENQGWLPSGVGPTSPPLGLRLSLELPAGVSLLAGDATRELGHLPGLGMSPSFEWLLVAPEETLLRLTLSGAWMPPVVSEVRL